MNSKKNTILAEKSISAAKFTILFRGLAQIMSLVTIVVLVRVLSEHDYGIYNLLYTMIAIIGMLFSFGIANTLQRYIPGYYSKGEFSIAHNIQKVSSLIRLVSNVSIIFVFIVFWENIAPLLKIQQYKDYFFLFSLVIILHFQRGILEVCLTSFFLHKYSQGLSCIFILVKGIGYVLALYFMWDLWAILTIDLFASVIVFLGLQIAYTKKIPKYGGTISKINSTEKKKIMRYAFFYNFNDAGVGFLDSSTDNMFLAFYLNPIAVGAYAFCHKFTYMIGRVMPISYLIEVIRPAFFSHTENQSIETVNRNFQLIIKLIYVFQIPALVFITVFSEQIIEVVFDGKFIEYSWVLITVFAFSVVNAFQTPVGLVAQYKERVEIILYSKIFAVYNILGNILLIPYIGIWGAVIATGTAMFARTLFIWCFIKKEASFRGMTRFFLSLSIFWLFVGALLFGINFLLESLIIEFFLGLVIFTLCFLFTGNLLMLTDNEKSFIKSLSSSNKKLTKILNLLKIDLGK